MSESNEMGYSMFRVDLLYLSMFTQNNLDACSLPATLID